MVANKQFPNSLVIHEDIERGEIGAEILWWEKPFTKVIKNKAGNPGFDIGSFHQLMPQDPEIGSVSTIFTAVQVRWREPTSESDPKVTIAEVKEAYKDTVERFQDAKEQLRNERGMKVQEQLKLLENCRIILVIFTNKRFSGEEKRCSRELLGDLSPELHEICWPKFGLTKSL